MYKPSCSVALWKTHLPLSDVEGLGCYSCVSTEPQCILLVFMTLQKFLLSLIDFCCSFETIFLKRQGLGCLQCDLCDNDEFAAEISRAYI